MPNLTEISLFMAIMASAFSSEQPTQYELQEVHCLAKNVMFEAGVDSDLGKRAVAHVTLNRAEVSRFPDSVCEVITDGYRYSGQIGSCQFSWYCDGKSDKIRLVKGGNVDKLAVKRWTDSIVIAAVVYFGRDIDPTNGATHYYNPTICFKNSIKDKNGLCHPPWAWKGMKSGRYKLAESAYTNDGMIGEHLFLVDTWYHKELYIAKK